MTTEEIIQKLLGPPHNFSRETLWLGIRAGFKCEYCDADLLASVDSYFYNWNNDHIDPASKGGENDFENMAVACKTCNHIKGASLLPKPAGTRRAKINAWKEWIRDKRTKKQRQLGETRELCAELLGRSWTRLCSQIPAADRRGSSEP